MIESYYLSDLLEKMDACPAWQTKIKDFKSFPEAVQFIQNTCFCYVSYRVPKTKKYARTRIWPREEARQFLHRMIDHVQEHGTLNPSTATRDRNTLGKGNAPFSLQQIELFKKYWIKVAQLTTS